jgi:1,4-alpha-glucan branching enzyme
MNSPGELALVLHTHMPYVEGGGVWPPADPQAHLHHPEGFGTWPFGEEWLWEAIATSYVPLLDALDAAPLTLSLTPVLGDQLEADGALARCQTFLEDIRSASHGLDVEHYRAGDEAAVVQALECSAGEYASAAATLRRLQEEEGGLLAALGAHARWTSAATHAVLPLLASDTGLALQIQSGIGSHRRRFGDWSGGFWLPECAYAPWLDDVLEQAGVAAVCVELSALFGLGDERHLWPVDRQTMALVWSEQGYPSHAAYRSYHAKTPRHHRVWRNDEQPYDPGAAARAVREHAAEFVGAVRRRVRRGGVCVCAVDTELLGHWWHEGIDWLRAVIDEAEHQGLALTTLDDALERHDPVPVPPELGVSSWGEGEDLRTWSGPAVADLAWQARAAELRLLGLGHRPPERALRELLALQASDWAFQVSRQSAGDYPRQRARAHAEALRAALRDPSGLDPRLRNLAPDLAGWLG